MSKYRIVELNKKYKIQKKGWFFWSELDEFGYIVVAEWDKWDIGGPKWYRNFNEALEALYGFEITKRSYSKSTKPETVCKEICISKESTIDELEAQLATIRHT